MRTTVFALLTAAALGGCADSSETPGGDDGVAGDQCPDPVAAVLATLDCVSTEDAACAADGYAPGFIKLHNGVDTNTIIAGPEYWNRAFQLVDLGLDINHVEQTDDDAVSIRYVESVTFITGDVIYQYEHALVTVDADCRMTLWDQYGDNQEQKAVDDKIIEILSGPPPSE